jgi:hypothetical protein
MCLHSTNLGTPLSAEGSVAKIETPTLYFPLWQPFDRSITLLITVYDFTRSIHVPRYESHWHLSAFSLGAKTT